MNATNTAKTAISLPRKTFARAERLAKQMKKSRSKLFTDAMEEYLTRHSGDAITEQANAVLAKVMHDPKETEWLRRVARKTLERVEW
jgi:metal-responsive CopG/Arc/MetJ family transcriptional regulator